jgi:hypothetical protein
MKTLPMASIAIAACVVLSSAGAALAQGTALTKQPGTTAGVNCGSATGPNSPGAASSLTPNGGAGGAKGSPFGGASAAGVYANAFMGLNPPSANAPMTATSQYDIACKNSQSQLP